jgi:hypothetical protein
MAEPVCALLAMAGLLLLASCGAAPPAPDGSSFHVRLNGTMRVFGGVTHGD